MRPSLVFLLYFLPWLLYSGHVLFLYPQWVKADWSRWNQATFFPWGFEVETCETTLASFQVQNCALLTENATWLLIADGLSPQIHGPCLTPWQHEMNLTPRGLWNTKNILETFPVLDTTHMNTWKLSVTIVTPPGHSKLALQTQQVPHWLLMQGTKDQEQSSGDCQVS